MKKIDTIINHQDSRGIIVDLIEGQNINAVTYITIMADAVRGNHYHKETTQWNYITNGSVKVVSQIGNEPMKQTILGKGELSITLPMEKHAFVGLEDSEMIVFTQGPRGGKEYESDTFRLDTPLV
jgi:quercetin dioxygenase-like cupin family protein